MKEPTPHWLEIEGRKWQAALEGRQVSSFMLQILTKLDKLLIGRWE